MYVLCMGLLSTTNVCHLRRKSLGNAQLKQSPPPNLRKGKFASDILNDDKGIKAKRSTQRLACHPDGYIWLNKRRGYENLVGRIGPTVEVPSTFP